MKFQAYCTWLLWVLFISFTAHCSDPRYQNTKLIFTEVHDSGTTTTHTEPFFEFNSGVRVYPNPDTEVNGTLLTEREGYTTIFTDPYGYLWTMSTAIGLTDQDFATAGVFLASSTNTGAILYYGKINTWEINADCVAYVAASEHNFVTIRRNQDQGVCPTAAGYASWMPRANMKEEQNSQHTRSSGLTAYGANNHQNNIVHGVFNDVKIYGNDPYGWPCTDFQLLGDCLAYTDIRLTGTKWDSAEFVSRYFISQYNHTPIWHGPAKYWYKQGYGLKKLANCGSVVPQTGDMLVSEGGSHGHAAIVRDVSDHSVTVIQQNWFDSEKDAHYTISMTSAGNHYCLADFGDGYPIAGWLRK